MGVHGIVDDLNKLQMGELPEEELRALEADLTGKVLTRSTIMILEGVKTINILMVSFSLSC